MPQTQISGLQVLDYSIKDIDIASDAAIAQSKISGLETALSGKQATLISGTNIKTVGGSSLLGSGDIAISVNESFVSLTSIASIDLSAGSWFNISISGTATISFSGTPTTGKHYIFAIKNTGASSITVTVPSGAITPATSVAIASGKTREFGMIYDGTYQRWQISVEVS